MQIVGIDCASDSRKVGIARGCLREDSVPEVLEVGHGLSRPELLSRLLSWLARDEATLLALDAPLGWPEMLRQGLAAHVAGAELPGEADRLFMRSTDHAIWRRLGKRPLEVGADRIARAARSALSLLADLRQSSGLAIPLAWSGGSIEAPAAIEVYPAATLVVHQFGKPSYKQPDQSDARAAILAQLIPLVRIAPAAVVPAIRSVDILDSCLCVLAGWDFLSGRSLPPAALDEARREGWIWA
jgi:hypothetical protein